MRGRLQGGIRNQAQRGELKVPLPVGFIYDPMDRVVFDPDQHVQQTLRALFDSFARTGSARAVVLHFRQANMQFPRRLRGGPHNGELVWNPLTHDRVLRALHNPRYAGAFVYGRSSRRPGPQGISQRKLPRDEWISFIPDAHPGYIDLARFEANQKQLQINSRAHGDARREGPPREGSALLQGLVICGQCGRRMTIRYNDDQRRPEYRCARDSIQNATQGICQGIPGSGIDRSISELLIQWMTPKSMDLAMQVYDELQLREDEVTTWHDQAIQQARHEVDLAQQRYLATNPQNRLVADVLEAEWNDKLRTLDQAQTEPDKHLQQTRHVVTEPTRQRLLELAHDFPRLWSSAQTPQRERKRMLRLLIEDVTLTRQSNPSMVHIGIRLRGGKVHELQIPTDPPAYRKYATPSEVIEFIDARLQDHCNDAEIARLLREQGLRTGHGLPFNAARVRNVRRRYDLKPLDQRLREDGWLTRVEAAKELGVHPSTVSTWSQAQLLESKTCNSANTCLYRIPEDEKPMKQQGQKLNHRREHKNLSPELGDKG